MKPAPFDYHAPATVEEAVSLLQRHGGDAKALAGGQSLMPLLNMRLARPAVIVDLNRIDGLDYIRENGGWLEIGALTRQRDVERSDLVRERQPLLHAATKLIAHPQIRNRGTVGGSLAHADPAAEYPAVALALGTEFRVSGSAGERTVDAADFFVTYLTTALAPDDVLTEVRVPALAAGAGWSFIEISRRHGDFALVGVATTLSLDGGAGAHTRVALFGVGSKPTRVPQAEAILAGERPSAALFEGAARKAAEEIEEPLSDVHATAEYRRHLAYVLTRRALTEAAARAREAA